MNEEIKPPSGDTKSSDSESTKFFGSTILFVLLIASYILWFSLGLAKLVIGAVYVNDCDEVEMIPIWLIIDGFVYIPFAIGLIPFYKGSSDSTKHYAKILLIVGIVVSIGWNITGAAFIYPNNNNDVDCSKVARSFAFAMLTTNWGTIGIWGQLVFRALADGKSCC
ncbi:uncharacterized protein LOC132720952 [Ruditapes philippinarum]|uniref:uncharacterized protein LOC132720952 n=1 Tax=Ruditapes philippinarum TaxID=129788 RepID=UPI00295A8785|nr:uncharacterized protein LOC132720952 [Ruditapes philippinarum]